MADGEKKYAGAAEIPDSLGIQIIASLHKLAKDNGLISEDAYKAYMEMRRMNLPVFLESREAYKKELDGQIAKFKELSDEKKFEISQLMGLETTVLNALHTADRKGRIDPVKENIHDFLITGLSSGKREEFIRHVHQLIEQDLLISLVHTMHPTIYHSPAHFAFEETLTKNLENMASPLARSHPDHKGISPEQDFPGIEHILENYIKALKTDKAAISHNRKITVPEENAIEQENLDGLAKYAAQFRKNWNDAVTELSGMGGKRKLTAAERDQLLMNTLRVEWRTWGQGCDADGRTEATSSVLYDTIQNYSKIVPGGPKTVPLLDLRQNAAENLDTVSALIQGKYHNSSNASNGKDGVTHPSFGEGPEFKEFCDKFRQVHLGDSLQRNDTILQEMPEGTQTKCIQTLLRRNEQLSPPELQADVIRFHKAFTKVFEAFKKNSGNREIISQAGLDPDKITFLDLVSNREAIRGVEILEAKRSNMANAQPPASYLYEELIEKMKDEGFELKESGQFYTSDETKASRYLFQNTFKLQDGIRIPLDVKNGDVHDLNEQEQEARNTQKRICSDVLKRLIVINDAIDKGQEHKVADRHQIANFEHARDFYSLLLLFKEAGLVEMHDGEVTKVKMGIQPLIEDSKTMRNADTMFEEILKDPIARSYYQKRGVAEFMLGCSDGAKSAGNFASEWETRECIRKLDKVFKDSGLNIKTRFFRGVGRGVDRGSPIEYGMHDFNMPDSATETGIYDTTIQSDLPLKMRMSSSYGKDAFGQMTLGTLQGAVTARIRKAHPAAEMKAREESNRLVIDGIARASEDGFKNLIGLRDTDDPKHDANTETAKDAALVDFLYHIPDNDFKSSRSKSRDPLKMKFATTRAVPVEYLFNMAGLPVHNVGLAGALQKFINGHGGGEKGMKAVAELYKHDRFFEGMITKIDKAMDLYNPTVALSYAEKCKPETREHIEKIIKDLDKLPKLIHQIAATAKARDGITGGPVHVIQKRKFDKALRFFGSQPVVKETISAMRDFGKESFVPLEDIQDRNWQQTTERSNNNQIGLRSATAVDQDNLTQMAQAMLLSFGDIHTLRKGSIQQQTLLNSVFVASESVSNRYSTEGLRNMASPAYMASQIAM